MSSTIEPERPVAGRALLGMITQFVPSANWREAAQTFTITLGAIVASLALFTLYMVLRYGVAPLDLYRIMYEGSFGSKVSIESSLLAAAPLILVALCTALPARVGLVIIGGDGALALGGLAAAMVGLGLKGQPTPLVLAAMALAGMAAGALLIALAGLLRHVRGVNETISSLLLGLISIGVFNFLVEGPLRDPNPISANKPSTPPIAGMPLLGTMFETDVHWGFGLGVALCVLTWVLMYHTTFGFAARMVGGNVRAAQGAGLPVGKLLLITCILGGAAAGLAGSVEIAAVQLQANSSLFARAGLSFGLLGVLISFIARHNPLAVIVVSIMIGGVLESSTRLQSQLSHLRVPDASAQVFLGILIVMIILSETLYGRFRIFQPRDVQKAMNDK
jgi:simple sugar transport system permease protein